ncbi:hypothetical protein ACFSM5_18935 [Lacibacterium aquatile]|uniref:DUF1328 domain-containing protein n=1 Tax=Lacibacterium aquatile TaxID=1168082 RepID=A0ABW5DV28_9PROT
MDYVLGVFLAALGILGLVLAANAQDVMMAIFGQALFVFAVLFDFGLIKRHFDRIDGGVL